MTELELKSSIRDLIARSEFLLLLVPAARARKPKAFAPLPPAVQRVLAELVRDLEPGRLGTLAESLTGTKPARVAVGLLPDRVSRHNAPSRAESIRALSAQAKLSGRKSAGVLLLLDDAAHLPAALAAVARTLPTYSARSNERRKNTLRLAALGPDGKQLALDAAHERLAAAVRDAAALVDTPPSDLHPAALAGAARRQLRGLRGVRIREITGPALLRAGLRAIHAVGRCADSPPRLLIAEWRPASARGPHIALVGKGLTYDTGGLHLKARGMMEGMKSDMGGAAAALGAFRLLAAERPRHRLTLLLAIAENAIGPAAYKPDDVLTMHSGLTVEINNTDAEGRLVLGDAVSYAARELHAAILLDAATLTGAQMVSTGLLHAAVVTDDDELERILVESGRASGDLVHPLPYAPEFHRGEFHSPLADMRNSVKDRSNAQSSCAAAFIHWHLDGTNVRWAHVDLAGPAFRHDRGTGYGVALLAESVRRIAASPTDRSAAARPKRRKRPGVTR